MLWNDKSEDFSSVCYREQPENCNLNQVPFFPLSGIFNEIPYVASRMPCIGKQIIHMIDRISIRTDDGQSAGNLLHARRVKGIVKPIWQFYGPLCWVIRNQHG